MLDIPHSPLSPKTNQLTRKIQAVAVLILMFLMTMAPIQLVHAESIAATSAAETTVPAPTTTAPTTPPILAADLTPDAIDWSDPASLAATPWPTLEQVGAISYVVIDRLSGAVLLAKDENTPYNPASTTKIMTALLAVENLPLEQQITASPAAVKLDWDATKAGFVAGETTTVRDAMAGLMLPSGNDAANMLAEAISGSVPAFAEKMNQRAQELNALHTHFVNPHGLNDGDHKISTYDMALIAAEAMHYPAFRELVSTSSYAMAATNKHLYNGWAILTNTNNRLLLADRGNYRSPLLASISGIKTGTTKAAGQCLVTAATTTDGHELICALFGVDTEDQSGNPASYTRTLLEAAALKAAQASPADQTVFVTKDQAIDVPDSKLQAIPARSLQILKNPGQATTSPTDLHLVWPTQAELPDLVPDTDLAAADLVPDTAGEIAVVQDGKIVLTIPVRYSAKPVVSPIDQLFGGETAAGTAAGESGSQVPSILEWPLLKPLLITLGMIVTLILAFGIGLSLGRQGRKPTRPISK